MGPIAAVQSVMSKYFTLKGRASRSEYWWYALVYFLGFAAALAIDISIFDPNAPLVSIFDSVLVIYMIAMMIPNWTSTVRRLHDTGRSGLWCLLGLVPLASFALLVFLCQRSQESDNIFGPPPNGSRRRSDAFDTSTVAIPPVSRGRIFASKATPQPSPQEQQAARRAEMRAYYESRVIGKGSPA